MAAYKTEENKRLALLGLSYVTKLCQLTQSLSVCGLEKLVQLKSVYQKAVKYSTYSRYISSLWTSSVLARKKKEKASKKNSFDVLSPNSISFFHFRLLQALEHFQESTYCMPYLHTQQHDFGFGVSILGIQIRMSFT